jgi:IS5 family transposase
MTGRACVAGSAIGAGVTVYALLARPWHVRWGASDAGVSAELLGDDLMHTPISARRGPRPLPPHSSEVWLWIAQLGQGRGGYTATTSSIHVVLPPQRQPNVTRRQVEHRRAFKKMVRWRTGCEGRISCAKRDFGLNRTRIDGIHGTRTWWGHGIFAHNLTKIAGLIE